MDIPVSDHLELGSFSKNTFTFLFHIIVIILGSRRTGEVVASTCNWVNINLRFRMEIPTSYLLELSSICKCMFTFLFHIVIILGSRSTSKVVASTDSWINSNLLPRMKVPVGNLFEFSCLLKNTLTFLFHIIFFVVIILGSRRTGEVIASTSGSITNDWLFWMEVPVSGGLQLLQLLHDRVAFIFHVLDVKSITDSRKSRHVVILIVVRGRSRRTSKVIASTSGSIRQNNWLFRMKVPVSGSLQLLQIFHDCIAFIFHVLDVKSVTDTRKSCHEVISIVVLIRSWCTSKVVTSEYGSINNINRLFRMKEPIRSYFQFFQLLHDCATFVFHILNDTTITDTRKSCGVVIIIIVLSWSWCTSEVVTSEHGSINNINRLFRMKIMNSKRFQILSISQDKLTFSDEFCFWIFNE